MSETNKIWSDYLLRLERESNEYKYESWYNHFWNEIYEIEEGADKTSRGERIRIDELTEDLIRFTFYDEACSYGEKGEISFSNPKVCLRSKKEQGGRNEYAWARYDYVYLKLEKK